MNNKKAIEIVRGMNKKQIESATLEYKPTPQNVVWLDKSNPCQRHKHVQVGSLDTLRKYMNRNLIG